MDDNNKPIPPLGPDVKWRYFHPYGERPTAEETNFSSLNLPPVCPEEFPEWKDVLDTWASKLYNASITLAQMLAVGLDLPVNTFSDMMFKGPHLLAPTASDLSKYGTEGQILAGFHQDLNFMTLHGKSRYSGLDIWLRDGSKTRVSIPDGSILIQAGMQMEILTAGHIKAGYHQVVINSRTVEQIAESKEANRSLWRISSTMFNHIASDELLTPKIGSEEEISKYPPILAGDHVARELDKITLFSK
eukprot:TRINITY_DN943_c0_g1_i2.p1 TRINITY_DN943_c0_g1~~TRINITY_DN943_c0_g1_i2.p1  ORF type:complete len:246 (-),score=56.93 TRINITY_DN943_c0_g1_i2:27-764(-)